MIKEKIREHRLIYEKETSSLQTEYKSGLDKLTKKLSSAQSTDYAKPYRDRYTDFCSAMERYHKKLLSAEKNIHGLNFYVEKYMPRASVLYKNEKNIEENFEDTVLRVKEIAKQLEERQVVSQYEKLLKDFCNMFATMRYIDSNCSTLLKKSGLPERDRQVAIAAIEKEIFTYQDDYNKASEFCSLKCYQQLMNFRLELISIYDKSCSELLGATTPGDDGSNKYIIGFQIEDIDECDAVFCEKVLEVERHKLGREPIYFEPTTGQSNIIINAPYDFLSSRDLYELIRNLYFSLACKSEKGMLRYGYIDCKKGSNSVSSIYGKIDNSQPGNINLLGGNGNFCYKGIDVFNVDKVKGSLEMIENDLHRLSDRHANVFEYNKSTDKNKEPLKFIIVNMYPLGFADSSRLIQTYRVLREIMTAYNESGCMFVVCQNTDDPMLQNEDIRFTADSCRALEVTLEDSAYRMGKQKGGALNDYEFTVSGKHVSMDITVPDFSEDDYWKLLKEHYSEKKQFLLKEIYKKIDRETDFGRSPISLFDRDAVEIPLGLNGNEDFVLRYPLNAAGHTLIFGGTQSGKSSFLHTFILSMCYKYSPDDIQLYLMDFKETEFAFYERHRLPHIKYYLCKYGVSEVCDTFEMIERIRKRRGRIMKSFGCSDIVQYNKKVKTSNDKKMQKLPLLFFIIDEAQVMCSVKGLTKAHLNNISQYINTILSQARSAGILLFLTGQDLDEIKNYNTANINTYIFMGNPDNHDMELRRYWLNSDTNIDLTGDIKDFLKIPFEGHCLIKSMSGKVADKVRCAYAGADSKAEYASSILALPIHKGRNYPPMILGGNDEPVSVSKYSGYLEELMQDDPSEFNLNLGIGSISGFQSPITFATENKCPGWMVYSEQSESICNILRNAAFAFIYKTAVIGYDYSHAITPQRVLYFGENRNFSMTMGDKYFGSVGCPHPRASIQKLNVNREAYDICVKILELYDEMNRRRDALDDDGVIFSETTDYPPYLLIFQSLKWLSNENISQVIKERQSETEKTVAATPSVDTSFLVGKAFDNASNEDVMSRIKQLASLNMKPDARQQKKAFLASSVQKSLVELFENGSRYGIFIIINPEDKEIASSIFGGAGAWNSKYWRNGVFGTFYDFTEVEEDKNVSDQEEAVCYVGESRIKTRLYDYSVSEQSDWWTELNDIMGGM